MSQPSDDGGPAFPVPPVRANQMPGGDISWDYASPGMSLLDYYAGEAMKGYLSSGQGTSNAIDWLPEKAYDLAERMIAEKNRRAKKS